MRKIPWLGLLFALVTLVTTTSAQAGEIKLSYTLDPPITKIHPVRDVARLVIRARRQDGTPVGDVRLHLELDSPVSGAVISTDFPIVEATKLFVADVIAKNGVYEMTYMFPIRGAYKLTVTASPATKTQASFPKNQKIWTLTVAEAPSEVRNMIILFVLLSMFGGLSGIILGRSARRAAEVSDEQ